jgi:hypothetical protein
MVPSSSVISTVLFFAGKNKISHMPATVERDRAALLRRRPHPLKTASGLGVR